MGDDPRRTHFTTLTPLTSEPSMRLKYKLVSLALIPLAFLAFFALRSALEARGEAKDMVALEELV